ncbi:Pvc16 family protein [Sorangium sp. So ce131]|uniref:DUF4255 domain-containing protein n=1 Tax=Sorangium sp. So ce131 TaxID=3133282 RepID=UPI003F6358A8
MSNSLAIAATTATLRNLLLTQVPLLDADLSDLEVTTSPPDLARKGVTKAQLNLFLYLTTRNAAWRNLDLPRQVRPGEMGAPPLALDLHYLITAYGRGESDNDSVSHRVLGSAMSALHDRPVLMPGEIGGALAGNDLGEQFERLKITPLPLTLEDMSKLWTMFQSQYRVSVAYEVTVLLIDSRSPVRAPLPVLKRGPADQGPVASATAAPALTGLRLPRSQPAARLGEEVVLLGERLATGDAVVRFTSSRLEAPIELAPAASAGGELSVHLPDEAEDAAALSRWAPGGYTAALVLRAPGAPTVSSNELAFALAPRITVAPATAAPGTVNLTITCRPRVVPGQRVLLLFGDRQVEPTSISTPADTAQPSTLAFSLPGVAAGAYVVRLRVDGVDSIPVIHAGTPPLPSFDPAQRVTVA